MKKSLGLWISLIIIILILNGCENADKKEENKNVNEKEENPIVIEEDKLQGGDKVVEKDMIEEKLRTMSIEEKLGQLFIIGLEDTEIQQNTINLIEEYKIGGFIFFRRNVVNENQFFQLINDLKEANSQNDIPLFMSIDEEGGRVSRMPEAFLSLPTAKAIGDKNNQSISFTSGEILGKRLKALGLNLNFAPSLDINSNPKNPVIGDRAFGSTIERVVDNGIQVMKGMNSTGIISCVKHFPGHGDTGVDSHIDLPVENKSLEEVGEFELVPFKNAIKEDVDMIMVAHILFKELDGEKPATMSRKIIDGILRNQMNYNGIVISDDLTMGAILKNYQLEDAVLDFFQAGGDIALICHEQDNFIKSMDKVKEKVQSGDIKEEEIDKKVRRILKIKEKYNLVDSVKKEIDLEKVNEETISFIEELKSN